MAVVIVLASARSRRLSDDGARHECPPAELLRAILVATPRDDRAALLRRYQRAEKVPTSGRWDLATSAAAETRLSDFGPPAREGLARVLERDPFFAVQ